MEMERRLQNVTKQRGQTFDVAWNNVAFLLIFPIFPNKSFYPYFTTFITGIGNSILENCWKLHQKWQRCMLQMLCRRSKYSRIMMNKPVRHLDLDQGILLLGIPRTNRFLEGSAFQYVLFPIHQDAHLYSPQASWLSIQYSLVSSIGHILTGANHWLHHLEQFQYITKAIKAISINHSGLEVRRRVDGIKLIRGHRWI